MFEIRDLQVNNNNISYKKENKSNIHFTSTKNFERIPEQDSFISGSNIENKVLCKDVFSVGGTVTETATGKPIVAETELKQQHVNSEIEEEKTDIVSPPKILSREEIENPQEVKDVMNKIKLGMSDNPAYVRLNNPKDYGNAIVELKSDNTIVVSYIDKVEMCGTPQRLITKTYDNTGNETNVLIVRPVQKFAMTENSPVDIEILESKNNEPLHNIGTVKNTKYGQKIERNFTSLNGLKSAYKLTPTEKGHQMSYAITDKNGSILMDITRNFEKINDNHIKTTVNDLVYDTEYNDDNIVVKKIDSNGELIDSKVLDLGTSKYKDDYDHGYWGDYLKRHYFKIPGYILDTHLLDKSLKNLYKQIPGDFLYKLAENKTRVRYGEPLSSLNSCYDQSTNTIFISEESKNDVFTLVHEIGHAIDLNMQEPISSENSNFQKILEKGFENMSKGEYLCAWYLGTTMESVAESMAILSGVTDTNPNRAIRSSILELKNPEVIVEAGKYVL